jgi:hypothetical protein
MSDELRAHLVRETERELGVALAPEAHPRFEDKP